MELTSVKAVITGGGGGGMGQEFVLQMARAGAQVVFCDVDVEGIERTLREAEPLTGRVKGVRASVADEADVGRLFDEAHDFFGPANCLVNNAAIFRDQLLVKKDPQGGAVKRMPLENFTRVIDIDLVGPFLCAREFAARAIEQDVRPAVIVNMASRAHVGNTGQSNYSAAKAGVVSDTKVWAQELAPHGIRTGVIAPGMIETPLLMTVHPKERERITRMIPLGRLGRPSDVWLAVKFIIECDYFTGRLIDVDGGVVV